MGNSGSHSDTPDGLKNSPNFHLLSSLFQEASTVNNGTRIITLSTMKGLFSNVDEYIAELLFKHIIVIAGGDLSKDELREVAFISGLDKIMKLELGTLDMMTYYFSMFNNEKQEINAQDVDNTLTALYTAEFPINTHETSSFFGAFWKSLVDNDDSSDGRLDLDKCVGEIFQLLPRLFNHIHWRILRSLRCSNPMEMKTDCTRIEIIDKPTALDSETLWLLSLSIPATYLTNVQKPAKCNERQLRWCEWSTLYDSNEHGLSHNRFKHHLFSYHGPTVTKITLGNNKMLLLALDVEWRESTKCFGEALTRLYQVNPNFKILDERNIVMFNERRRGIPVGLTIGNNPNNPMLSLRDGLTLATFCSHEIPVIKIESWGCAGEKAQNDQKQQQKWERRQAEKLQKVKLPGDWDENPDKAILNMAGITTEHAQR